MWQFKVSFLLITEPLCRYILSSLYNSVNWQINRSGCTALIRTYPIENALTFYILVIAKSKKVKAASLCCLTPPVTISIFCVASEYRTGSEVDSLWVQASVAEGSALPWKIEHLGASWKSSLPCCATMTKVPTGSMPPPARSHWTKADQMVPLPSYEQPLRTAHHHVIQPGGWIGSPDNLS